MWLDRLVHDEVRWVTSAQIGILANDEVEMSATTHVKPNGFVHSAYFYRSEHEYLNEVVPFILGGLAMDEPVIVGVPTPKLAMLRDALSGAVAKVTMADMAEVGRNPARIMGLLSTYAAAYPDRRVRMVGEPVWPGRADDEYPGCVEHEALSNTLFDGHPVTALCPYDARLGERVVADARMTHPFVWQAGSADRNAEYAPEDALTRYNQPLPVDPMAITHTVNVLADLSPVRSFAASYGSSVGLSPDRVADLQLIVTELATNSVLHTGGSCRLGFWLHNGHFVCEARDGGRFNDPLAGRRAPVGTGGRGLFLVNAIADLVRTHTTPSGTTIQAYLRLGPAWETMS